MKSTRVGPAFIGGPSGAPVTLMMPEAAWIVRSIARLSRSGPADAEPGAGRVDQARVDLVQHRPADPEIVHRARREILQQHIGPPHHLEQQFAPARMLEVQGHRALVLVQHRERQCRAGRPAAPAGAAARPDGGSILITSAPPFASSKRRVRPLKNLPEIDDDETGQRQPPRSLRVVRHAPSRPLRLANLRRPPLSAQAAQSAIGPLWPVAPVRPELAERDRGFPATPLCPLPTARARPGSLLPSRKAVAASPRRRRRSKRPHSLGSKPLTTYGAPSDLQPMSPKPFGELFLVFRPRRPILFEFGPDCGSQFVPYSRDRGR